MLYCAFSILTDTDYFPDSQCIHYTQTQAKGITQSSILIWWAAFFSMHVSFLCWSQRQQNWFLNQAWNCVIKQVFEVHNSMYYKDGTDKNIFLTFFWLLYVRKFSGGIVSVFFHNIEMSHHDDSSYIRLQVWFRTFSKFWFYFSIFH